MPPTNPKQIALRFNDCINRQDVDGLSSLMTEDHTFIDRQNDTYARKDDEAIN
jgi:hypothetical protein